MKKTMLALFALLTVLGGTAIHAQSVATAGEGDQPLPFSARWNAEVAPVLPISPCDTDGDGVPDGIRLDVTGSGEGAALGRYSFVAIACFNAGTGMVADAHATLTAANGDQIFTTYSGTVTPVGATLVSSFQATLVGGTGRFEGASGTTLETGVSDPPGFMTGQSTGTITYSASDTRN